MNILIVLAGLVNLDINKIISEFNIDYIIAVDGGYNHLQKQKICCDVLIGDLDSINVFDEKSIKKVVKLNVEKDYTDYEATLNYIDNTFIEVNKIYVIGFASMNRLEHFYNNLNLLRPQVYYINEKTTIYMVEAGEYEIIHNGYISFFAYDNVEGLTLENFKYPLNSKNLNIHESLCISNEVNNKSNNKVGKVKFISGKLIVFLSSWD